MLQLIALNPRQEDGCEYFPVIEGSIFDGFGPFDCFGKDRKLIVKILKMGFLEKRTWNWEVKCSRTLEG